MFQVGTKVRWTLDHYGYTGTVVEVVGPDAIPTPIDGVKFHFWGIPMTPRPYESYLIRSATDQYEWPSVQRLRTVDTPMHFIVGDLVWWRSQSRGYDKEKIGEVLQVVPAGERPDRERFLKMYKGPGVGFGRDHESYVVQVKNTLYWPLTKNLRAYGLVPRESK